MANVELKPEPMSKPAEQVSPFPKEPKPANSEAEPETAPMDRHTSEESGNGMSDRIKRYQDASADAMNDIAQSMIRGWTEMVRGVRKAFDRF